MQRDKEDKILEKQRLREKRTKKKWGGKTNDGGEDEDEDDEDDGLNKKTKLFAQKRYFMDDSSDDASPRGGSPIHEEAKSNLGNLSLSLQESIALDMLKSRQC